MPTKTRRHTPKAGEGKSLLDVDALRAVVAATPPEATPAPDAMPITGDQPDIGGAAMVAFMLPPDIASKLAVDGGLPPEKLHITLIYLGPDATTALDRAKVEAAINAVLSGTDEEEDSEEASAGQPDTDAISGVFNGVARFTATEDPDGSGAPIVLTLDAPGLDEFRADLCEGLHALLDFPEDTHGFVPHCTIQYVQGSDADPIPLSPPPMVDVTFDSVTLAWGDPSVPENLTTLPLAGTADETEATEPPAAPEPADAAEPAPAMGLATEPSETPGPDAVPDEGRVEPVPGPLGMWEACLVTEGVATDEVFQIEDGQEVQGRFIPEGTLTWRTPPLPGGFAVNPMGSPADNGHMGAPIACAATEVWRDGNHIMARGPYLDNADGSALKMAVDGGAPIGPSIDLGASDMWEITTEADGASHQTLLEGSIAGFVVLPYEAQHSTPDGEWLTWFRSVDAETPAPEAMPDQLPAVVPIAASGVTWENLVACAAGNGAPVHPPAEWFEPPEMDGPTALHVTAEGRVWGHLAGPGCHIGIPGQCVTAAGDTSKDFTLFHHGRDDGQGIVLADGSRLRVGVLTIAGGHADLRVSAEVAKEHYDDSDSSGAFLRAGWDKKNDLPYIAGSIISSVPEDKLQIIRGLGQSGDWRAEEVWRTIDGKPTLIAVTVVPVEGFPKMRRALAAGGFIEVQIVDTALGLQASGQFGPTGGSVTDAAWDGSASRFNDEQYERAAAACEPADKGSVKTRCFLPHHEPDGTINRNGVHAAAQRVSALSGRNPDAVSAAKAHLRSHYTADLKEEPPDSLGKPSSAVTADALVAEMGRDFYSRRLWEEAALLASAHERERETLAVNLR